MSEASVHVKLRCIMLRRPGGPPLIHNRCQMSINAKSRVTSNVRTGDDNPMLSFQFQLVAQLSNCMSSMLAETHFEISGTKRKVQPPCLTALHVYLNRGMVVGSSSTVGVWLLRLFSMRSIAGDPSRTSAQKDRGCSIRRTASRMTSKA
jgi:hypothetical protein